MKQHITIKQINELSEKGKMKLLEWSKNKKLDGWMVKKMWNKPYLEKEEKVICNKWHCSYCEGDESTWPNDKTDFVLLSIGQMIEFISEYREYVWVDWGIYFGKNLAFVILKDEKTLSGKTLQNGKGELCDGLWEAVKEVLEK